MVCIPGTLPRYRDNDTQEGSGEQWPRAGRVEVTFMYHLLSGNLPAVTEGTLAKESGKLRRPLALFRTALCAMAAIRINPGAHHCKKENVSSYSKGLSLSHKGEWDPSIYSKMDEIGGLYAKRKKATQIGQWDVFALIHRKKMWTRM